MASDPDSEVEQAKNDDLAPLPMREPQVVLDVRPIVPMRNLDILRRVKEGLERMG